MNWGNSHQNINDTLFFIIHYIDKNEKEYHHQSTLGKAVE